MTINKTDKANANNSLRNTGVLLLICIVFACLLASFAWVLSFAEEANEAEIPVIDVSAVAVADDGEQPTQVISMRSFSPLASASAPSVGTSFSYGSINYEITKKATKSTPGEVVAISLVQPFNATMLTIPDTVRNKYSGCYYSYTVIRINPELLASASSLTSLTIESSATSGDVGLKYLYKNKGLKTVTVGDANPYYEVKDGVLYYTTDKVHELVALLPTSTVTEFTVPEDVNYVGDSAFRDNATLRTVNFEHDLVSSTDGAWGGIGDHAFEDCAALEDVNFAEGVRIENLVTSTTSTIGVNAFKGCTSLESITIPALTSTTRKGNLYHMYASTTTDSCASSNNGLFLSGFSGYWNDGNGPVMRAGFGAGVFEGCTNLKTVTFRAGAGFGLFSYFISGVQYFTDCTSLESIAYEASMPYWTNPELSMKNGVDADKAKPTDFWATQKINAVYDDSETLIDYLSPDSYVAVDYYATDDESVPDSDDAEHSNRMSRVEYELGTASSDIATSSDALADKACDSALYVERVGDGVIPDPNETALALKEQGVEGFEDADAYTWVWRIGGTQKGRDSLNDSCSATLAHASDLSSGCVTSPEMQTMLSIARKSQSEYEGLEGRFDPWRYSGLMQAGQAYPSADYSYKMPFEDCEYYLGEGNTCWFTLDSTGLRLEELKVTAADGTELSSDEYDLAFQRFVVDGATGEGKLVDAAATESGLYYVTIIPKAETGYTGQLQEWMMVEAHGGMIAEKYADDAHDTANAAANAFTTAKEISSNSLLSVNLGTADADAALVGVSFAGLVGGKVNVERVAAGEDAMSGFTVTINKELTTSYPTVDSDTASTFANFCYKKFNEHHRNVVSESEYPWGRAVLCAPDAMEDCASVSAYIYATHAAVFFTEEDGSVSEETLSCLKDFDQVVVAADETLVSADQLTVLSTSLGAGASVTRIAEGLDEGDAAGFSMAIADALLDEKLIDTTNVAIVDTRDPFDTFGALNLTGLTDGVTLNVAGSADSKRVFNYLREKSDDVSFVALFGRDASVSDANGFSLGDTLDESLWSLDDVPAFAVDTGDTLAFHGVQFKVTSSSTIAPTGTYFDKWRLALEGEQIEQGGVSFKVNAGLVTVSSRVKFTVSLLKNGYTNVKVGSSNADILGVEAKAGESTMTFDPLRSGAAAVTATIASGAGESFTGTANFTVSLPPIDLANAEMADIPSPQTFTGSAIEPDPVITIDGMTLVRGLDYEVEYENNFNASGTADSVVRAVGIGDVTGSIEKKFHILRANISDGPSSTLSVSGVQKSYVRTGGQIKPEPVLTYGTYQMVEGTDYTLEYGDNIDVGSGSIRVVGKGNFYGNFTISFTIATLDITTAEFELSQSDFTYTGRECTPSVTATRDGEKLMLNRDYEVDYLNDVDAGEATAVISGKGAYAGEKRMTYTISPADLEGAEVTFGNATYTGNEVKPKATVTVIGLNLVQDVDYTVAYEDNVNAGEAKATFEGIGNFTGNVSKAFTIEPASIAKATIEGVSLSYTYTGSPIEPTVSVRWGQNLLSAGDFTTTYSNNIEPGTATVTVAGVGNFKDVKTRTFAIAQQKQDVTPGESGGSSSSNGSGSSSTATNETSVSTITLSASDASDDGDGGSGLGGSSGSGDDSQQDGASNGDASWLTDGLVNIFSDYVDSTTRIGFFVGLAVVLAAVVFLLTRVLRIKPKEDEDINPTTPADSTHFQAKA